ncbi:MAG: DNA mismatch repair endonuclease MutL [candidate division KSB1 bacterium]|nr:DNA mismatch repair endonuclease MutL [candidate division KSB1 bacterium]
MGNTVQKIAILPPSLTNKIAAGEVVERPASVVKELVENSLDAGADDITVILRDGGKALIQVIDNGCGMSPADAVLAFQRHATSKIRTLADLQRVTTLGFRGEALASIASVSRVELRTVPQGEIEGTLLRLDGGRVVEQTRTGGKPGTSIAVKNLFFNTPARRKFLRATNTEYRYVLQVMNRFALAFPEVRFTLIHEDREVFRLPKSSLPDRVLEVLGTHLRGKLVEVEETSSSVAVRGFVGTPDTFRRSRGDQYLFVNRRYVVNRALGHAVLSAYGESLLGGLLPVYVIFLEIPPELVDVNVHPTKIEIKLWDEDLVYRLVRGAVRRSVSSGAVAPELTLSPAEGSAVRVGHAPFLPQQRVLPLDGALDQMDLFLPEPERLGLSTETRLEPVAVPPPVRDVEMWQIHNRYILTEVREGLIVIDQHVAHERILYEKAMRSFRERRRLEGTQQLIFPETVDLNLEDFSLFLEIQPFLEQLGFAVRVFGARSVLIEGLPAGLRLGNPSRTLVEIIDEYGKEREASLEIHDSVARSYACKAAIKAGDRLSLEEMNKLVNELFSCEQPYFCPHGRPIVVQITLAELNRRFGRE